MSTILGKWNRVSTLSADGHLTWDGDHDLQLRRVPHSGSGFVDADRIGGGSGFLELQAEGSTPPAGRVTLLIRFMFASTNVLTYIVDIHDGTASNISSTARVEVTWIPVALHRADIYLDGDADSKQMGLIIPKLDSSGDVSRVVSAQNLGGTSLTMTADSVFKLSDGSYIDREGATETAPT